jgi:hypothetical protein
MKFHLTSIALIAILGLFTFMSSALPVAADDDDDDDDNKRSDLLYEVSVNGVLEDGSIFKGTATITEFGYDDVEGLVVSGKLRGDIVGANDDDDDDDDDDGKRIRQNFVNVPATLRNLEGQCSLLSGAAAANTVNAQAAPVCDILFLDLGPLNLDLLGLTVDLSRIILDINAVPGAGNLLGNLLCAVAGLLDPSSGLLTLIENLGQLLDLLGQINDLLG